MTDEQIQAGKTIAEVKYEIRGQLAHRAYELENRGYEIQSLNIGNGVSELIDLSLRDK